MEETESRDGRPRTTFPMRRTAEEAGQSASRAYKASSPSLPLPQNPSLDISPPSSPNETLYSRRLPPPPRCGHQNSGRHIARSGAFSSADAIRNPDLSFSSQGKVCLSAVIRNVLLMAEAEFMEELAKPLGLGLSLAGLRCDEPCRPGFSTTVRAQVCTYPDICLRTMNSCIFLGYAHHFLW